MEQMAIIRMAQLGRPDLAAKNAGLCGDLLLAAECAKFPHSSGVYFPVRALVYLARSTAREAE